MNLQNEKDIKIAFFDIDGTLIDMNRKVISDQMLECLIRLKENHVILCIATGRPPVSVPHFPGIEFDAFLTFNASYCFTKDAVILSNPIPASDVQQIIKNAASIGRPVALASKDRMGSNGIDNDLTDYFPISKQTIDVAEDFDAFAQDEIYQIMLGCRAEDHDLLVKNAPGAKVTAWWDRAADIIPSNGGKGMGVGKILSYYGLTKDQAIAFGDGSNDIEMLEAAGTGVAMGNATENVKNIADVVCGSVADEGIYHYCLDHHLI